MDGTHRSWLGVVEDVVQQFSDAVGEVSAGRGIAGGVGDLSLGHGLL